jgi:hypothetical protein
VPRAVPRAVPRSIPRAGLAPAVERSIAVRGRRAMNARAPRTWRWRARGGLASILLALVLALPAASSPAVAAPAASGAPAAAAPAAVTVSIGDGLDAAAVQGRLAAELKTPIVPRPDGGACALPCLSVTADGGSATVAFTPLRGAPRARTVELGADPAQWPVVIALLAGNLVRDEAADVLALLPEPARPPAAPAPPAPPAPTPAVPDAPATAPAPPAAPGAPAPAVAPALAAGAASAGPPGAAVAGSAVAFPGAASLDASIHVAPAPAPERPSTLLGIGFVPGLSTDFTRVGRVQHFLSLDLVAGVSGGSTGVTVSGVADIERGRVWGFQAAGVASLAWRVAGFQVAGVAAVAGELDGVQLAGTAAVADSAEGAQVGGVAAVSRGRADLQIAGVAAFARGRASTQLAGIAATADGAARIQLAGVAAVARGDTNIQAAGVASVARGASVQAAGVASVAHGTANIQVAGVVNVARRLEGVQIAPINVARRVDGVQVGVINVGSADGFSFGLINIVPGGRADLEAAVDSSRLGTLLFRHGGRRWHNVYGVGGHPVDKDGIGGTGGSGDRDDVWMYGLGFGPSWRAGQAIFDLELLGWQINHGAAHYDGLSLLGQLRLSMAYGLGPFQVVAGGAFNAHVSSDPQSPLVLERRTSDPGDPPMTREVRVVWWPSAFIGVRI